MATLAKSISHYTDLGGLIGILTKARFWASNVSFLNDRKELWHGLELLQEVLNRKPDILPAPWLKAFLSAAEEFQQGKIPDTFVICFCEQSDALSLWRGYGVSAQNVSITFGRSALLDALERSKPDCYKVVYGKTRVSQDMIKRFSRENVRKSMEEFAGEKHLQAAKMLIGKIIPKYKHWGFRDEREWRFVFQGEELADVRFRPRGGILVPYLEIGPGGPEKMGIEKITVGPGPDPELTSASIKQLLRKVGLEAPVVLSGVPFRN